MQSLLRKSGKTRLIALSAATSAVLAFSAGSALAISQSGEQKDMKLVGHVDLQGRGAYQPNFIKYPDGRIIAFAGLHPSPNLNGVPAGAVKNPLNGNVAEPNGTMIIDITNPKNPVQKFHIPGSAGGTYTMVRLCLGSDLPAGTTGHVYMLRNVQGGSLSGYEVWDVTNLPPVGVPVLVSAVRNLRSTHKSWWECNTGIAYLPGSKNTAPLWRQSQSMVIVDWSNPAATPVYIRTHGLPGGQPSGTGPVPTSLHGAISAHEHPNAADKLVSGVDAIGNRIYAAWGVGSNGVLQILDRKKLLPPTYGGTYIGDADDPTNDQLISAQVGRMDMSPDQGGHTSMPVFGVAPKSLQCSSSACPGTPSPDVRDIVVLTSEAGNCDSQHWGFIVDVSTENSIGVRQDPWQGPMVLSTLWVNPQSGEKYPPRGNYCLRGQRFGTHSTEENFRNPYYGDLTFTSYFNAGVRAWDITDPQGAVEAGFYVPAAPNGTYMTNNVEVDNRGYIIIVDRIGNGMDILKLTGKARNIGLGKPDDDGGDDD